MNAEEVAETIAALRRLSTLVHTGQISDMAGCRIEGAVAALNSIRGDDPSSPYARSLREDAVLRLKAIREEGGLTEATARRIEGGLLAFESLTGDAASLLARLAPRQRGLPARPLMEANLDDPEFVEVRLSSGQPQTCQVQL